MDSVTQALLGAAVGQAVLGKSLGNKAILLGAVVGTLPDLDVILVPFFDELEKISIHRGYSHSILVNLGLATAFSFLSWKFWKGKLLSFGRWWLFFFLALITHILLDSFTSYGTQLFQPFSDARVAWDTIGIVDPVYSGPLLVGVIGALLYQRRQRVRARKWNRWGLIVSTLYLAFTCFNKRQVDVQVMDSLQKQGVEFKKIATVPVSFGSMLWYGVAKTDDGLYIGNYSVFDKEEIHFNFYANDELLLNCFGHEDALERLKWFANDFYVAHEHEGSIRFYNLKCDMNGPSDDGRAPTSFYYDVKEDENGNVLVKPMMHTSEESTTDRWKFYYERITRDIN
jgi:inner membrane protein